MDPEVRRLVEALHASPPLVVIAVSGAGSQALAWLLGVGGASRTLLEASVPYAASAMREYIGFEPAEYASPETATALAVAAHTRALALAPAVEAPLLGLGCAATIATDRTKRGEHRAYVALATAEATRVCGLTLEKGARDRAGEEALVSRLLLNVLAGACDIEATLELALRPSEALVSSEASR